MLLSLTMTWRNRPWSKSQRQSLPSQSSPRPPPQPYAEGYPIEWWFGSEVEEVKTTPRPGGTLNGTPSPRSERHDKALRPSRPPSRSPSSRSTAITGFGQTLAPKPTSCSSSESSESVLSSQATNTTKADSEYSEIAFHEYVTGMKKAGKRLGLLKPGHSDTSLVKPVQTIAQTKVSGSTLSTPVPDTSAMDLASDPATKTEVSAKTSSLTEAEREMYASERLDNFRWISKLVGSYADCKILEEEDLVPNEIKKRVDEIGQYSELVYSDVPVELLFKHHQALKEEGILSDYQAILSDCEFLSKIDGAKTDLSAFVVYRKSTSQLVVSISGSSRPMHMIQNLRAIRTPWPGAPYETPAPASTKNAASAMTVHSGFLTLYQDIKGPLENSIRDGIRTHAPQELVITGHSMGGSVSHLLCMDLLSDSSTIDMPPKVCLATYGAPRTGNSPLVEHFRKLVNQFKGEFEEYSVKAYNDGVPAVPPHSLGYAHFCAQPFYAFQRKLYRVPQGQSENSLFHVRSSQGETDGAQPRIDPQTNTFPRGGHNYYNSRDLEGFRRTTDWLAKAGFPEKPDWKKRYWKSAKRAGHAGEGK